MIYQRDYQWDEDRSLKRDVSGAQLESIRVKFPGLFLGGGAGTSDQESLWLSWENIPDDAPLLQKSINLSVQTEVSPPLKTH